MNIKRPKLFLSILVLVLVLGLLMAACQPQAVEEASPESAPAGSTTVEDEPAPAPTEEQPAAMQPDLMLDPAGGANAQLIEAYIYETLIVVRDEQFYPWLAENGIVANDGLDYIFELQPGVLFHDGTVFDVDAVIANFDRWFDQENELRGDGDFSAWQEAFGGFKGEVDADGKPISSFDGIEKVNDLTVLIHLNQPDPELFVKLSDSAFAIMSPTALATGSFVGTGPYFINEATDDNLSLMPFEDYWGEVAEDEVMIDLE